MDPRRRIWLITTGVSACVGTAATAVPFVESMEPSDVARVNGGPIELDISPLQPGQKLIVLWRGQPVWILRRTPQMLASLNLTQNLVADPFSKNTQFPTPPWAQNQWRSIKPEYFVFIDICTHLGCAPNLRATPGPQPGLPDHWPGGFLCPCHGSRYDLAARVFKNMPAPANMVVPDYAFINDKKILLGEHRA